MNEKKLVKMSHLLLSLDLYTDLKPDSTRHAGLIRPFLQIVPDVHFTGQGSNLDDGLTKKVIGLSSKFLTKLGFEVVVLVPHADLDSV